MFPKRLVGVAAVLVCAGMAVAAANSKIKDFSAAGAGVTANPSSDGMAMFTFENNPDEGTGLRLNLHMHDLEPNTTYGVAIYATGVSPAEGANYSDPLAFTTNEGGSGSFEDFLPGFDVFLGSSPRIQIYVHDFDPNPDNISFITPSELRADGIAQ